jgi:hypothetical protein
MCMVYFIGTDNDVPLIAFDPAKPAFNVTELSEQEQEVNERSNGMVVGRVMRARGSNRDECAAQPMFDETILSSASASFCSSRNSRSFFHPTIQRTWGAFSLGSLGVLVPLW